MKQKKLSKGNMNVWQGCFYCVFLTALLLCTSPVKARALSESGLTKYFSLSRLETMIITPSNIACDDGYFIPKGTKIGVVQLDFDGFVSDYSHYTWTSLTQMAEVWAYYAQPTLTLHPEKKITGTKSTKNGVKTKDYYVANGYALLHLPLVDDGYNHDNFIEDWVPRDVNKLDASQTNSKTISGAISNDGGKFLKEFAIEAAKKSLDQDGLSRSFEWISEFVTFKDNTDVEKRDFSFVYYFNKTNWLGICSSEREKRVYSECMTKVGYAWFSRNQKYLCTGTNRASQNSQFSYSVRFDIVNKKTNPKIIWQCFKTCNLDFSNNQ